MIMTAPPPRRAAAQIAEALNRAELQAHPGDEDGENEEDDLYRSDEDEDEQATTNKQERARRKRARLENERLLADEQAAKLFDELKAKEGGAPVPNILGLLKTNSNVNLNKMFAPWSLSHANMKTTTLPLDFRELQSSSSLSSPIKSQSSSSSRITDASTLLKQLSHSAHAMMIAQTRDGCPPRDGSVGSVANDALHFAQSALRTTGLVEISESVKYAGEMVIVTKHVDKLSKEAELAFNPAPEKTGLDVMIEGISKRKGISAVEKSTFDWEKYKMEHQLNEELKDASKDGYVEKQSFLGRIDERQFELEREERERARVRRELSKATDRA